MSSASVSTSFGAGAGAGAAIATGRKIGSTPYKFNKGRAALLSTFGLEGHEKEFTRVMRETYSFLTGGAMLYWWMNDIADAAIPFPEDMDLDIWMSIPALPSSTKMPYYWPTALMLNSYEMVLAKAGYRRQSDEDRERELTARVTASMRRKPTGEIEYRHAPAMRFIQKIVNFIHPDSGRKIQVIVVKDSSPRDITNTFDLDICKFVAVPSYDVLRFDHCGEVEAFDRDIKPLLFEVKPGAPLPMTMHLCDLTKGATYLPNRLARLEKYYGRGFVLEVHPEPCTTCGCKCKAKPITLTLAEAKEYVTRKLA
jgi:hypothetical protein